jgi:serine/threonine protein kinase
VRRLFGIALDIVVGVAHLHAFAVVHRDLACRNLLLSNTGRVIISDFGRT